MTYLFVPWGMGEDLVDTGARNHSLDTRQASRPPETTAL